MDIRFCGGNYPKQNWAFWKANRQEGRKKITMPKQEERSFGPSHDLSLFQASAS